VSTYAQVQHVEDAWREFTVREIPQVGHLLDRVEREIGRHVDVAARIAAGRTTAADVQDAVVAIAVRVLRNPAGVRSQSTGPFSQVIDSSVASGRIEITRADRRALGMLTGAGTVAVEDPAMATLVRHVETSSGRVPQWVIP
jgi:hypothetical protein